jgi:hypothetical protein
MRRQVGLLDDKNICHLLRIDVSEKATMLFRKSSFNLV